MSEWSKGSDALGAMMLLREVTIRVLEYIGQMNLWVPPVSSYWYVIMFDMARCI